FYRRGFPNAMTLGGLGHYSVTARIIDCCVTHGALEDEAQDLGLADIWSPGKEAARWHSEDANDPEEGFRQGWRVAEGVDEAEQADEAARPLAKTLTDTTERSRKPSAMPWRRELIDLPEGSDA